MHLSPMYPLFVVSTVNPMGNRSRNHVLNTHKLMGFYMEVLILGIILLWAHTGAIGCIALRQYLAFTGPDNHPLTIEDAGTLRVVLSPLAYDWFLLGIQLQIEPEVLKRFEHLSLPNQSQRRLSDLIGTWIKQGKNVTLEKLTEVLAGDTVRQRALALKLKTEYKG